ncbi:MAG: hypothetical protein LBV03_00080 [Fusobacteriales bacterium]|nr:hypothetical protein [Fusobacteriales bacterium]
MEKIGAKEGYELEVIYSDSSGRGSLDGKKGESYVDDKGRIVIVINTEAEGIGNKDVLSGVLAEELSHGINYADGKDKGAGTETLAGHSNDYFAGKVGDSKTSLSLTGDGKDYNGVDFGEHVGDKIVVNEVKNNGTQNSDSVRKAFISDQIESMYASGKINEEKKDELLLDISNLSKYNIMKKEDIKYFVDFYGKDNVDTISTTVDSNGNKIITYKEGNLSGADSYVREKTLLVRKLIDSEELIILQVPNNKQLLEMGNNKSVIEAGSYLPFDSTKPILMYLNPNSPTITDYVYEINPRNQSFLTTNMDEYSKASHEALIHPSDFIDYRKTSDFIYINKSKVIESPNNARDNNIFNDIIYFENTVREYTLTNGEKVFFIPAQLKYEANITYFEGLTRKKINGENIKNERILYDKAFIEQSIFLRDGNGTTKEEKLRDFFR